MGLDETPLETPISPSAGICGLTDGEGVLGVTREDTGQAGSYLIYAGLIHVAFFFQYHLQVWV